MLRIAGREHSSHVGTGKTNRLGLVDLLHAEALEDRTVLTAEVAPGVGVLVLNETFSVAMGIGFALVILGSTLATRRPGQVVEGPGLATVERTPG